MKILILILLMVSPLMAVEKGVKKAGKCWNYTARRIEINKEQCGAEKDGFRCSRSLGHKGLHHAHGLKDKCIFKWKQGKQ